MGTPAFFIEARFKQDPDRERGTEPSPFSMIEHPFRVMVFDQDFDLLSIATVGLGSAEEPTRLARLYAQSRPGYASAMVLNRNEHSVYAVLSKPINRNPYNAPPSE